MPLFRNIIPNLQPLLCVNYSKNCSAQFKDSGCKTFLEDVFENEYRFVPGGVWQRNNSKTWTDRVSAKLA